MADAIITAIGEQARWSLRLAPELARRFASLGGFGIAQEINRGVRDGERLSARLGPDEWLLCAPADENAFLRNAEEALASEHHSIVDVGHRHAAFFVEGPQAHVLLAAGCPLDLHPKVFTPGFATRTLFGKAEIVLWRLDEAPVYRVECARTYAPYVLAFLNEAAREFA